MCNELSNKEKKALKSIPIGTNANNNQTIKYNSATGRFEFTNGGGGSGDVTQAGNNDFTGSNNFATAPRVAGFDVATVNDLSNVLKLSAPITDDTTFVSITDYANNATGLSLTSAYFKSDVNYNGSSGFIVKNSANTGSAIAQLLIQNNAGNVGQIFAGSETSVYGANAFVMVQYKDAPMRFVSNNSNAFVFASNIAGTNQYAMISNTSIDLNKPTNINSSLALVNIAEPVGTAGKTTLYSDTSGRLTWKSGTGFTRTFDASSITANRTYTMPNADTTLAGLSVAQTFTANQTINANLAVGGTFAATARAHFRGDGTNPIARFEGSTGVYHLSVSAYAFGTILSMNGFSVRENTSSILFSSNNTGTSGVGELPIYEFIANEDNSTSLSSNLFRITRTFRASAGSANFRPFTVQYTINNTGVQTGTATGIFLNATETNLNGMTHNLMDLQVGGSSRFRVSNGGSLLLSQGVYCGSQVGRIGFSFTTFQANGVILLSNASENDFNRLQFGGTTSLFPALKRSSASLEVRLADDSGYANFRAANITGNSIVAGSTIFTASSSSANSAINVKSGTAPTTPIDGDIWSDGTDLYMQIAGATKRFSFVA